MDIRELLDSPFLQNLKQRYSKLNRRTLAPFVIVGVSVLLISFLVKVGPRALPKPHEAKLPGVKVQMVKTGAASIPVYTRGVVTR